MTREDVLAKQPRNVLVGRERVRVQANVLRVPAMSSPAVLCVWSAERKLADLSDQTCPPVAQRSHDSIVPPAKEAAGSGGLAPERSGGQAFRLLSRLEVRTCRCRSVKDRSLGCSFRAPHPVGRGRRLETRTSRGRSRSRRRPGAALAGSTQGTWRLLPKAPVAPTEGLSGAWTGKEMLLFGRVTRRAKDGAVLGRLDAAASYNPVLDTWRRLPSPMPTTGFADTSSVWTGKEMLVWGQGTREAFNPRTNRWRRLPSSKLLAVHDGFGLVVWTGREMIGWGGGCCGDAFDDGVAYNPTNEPLEGAGSLAPGRAQRPIGAWTGRELIVLVGGIDPDGNPWPARLARAAAYSPSTNTWRRIAPLPEPRNGATALWDGREALVVGGSGTETGLAGDRRIRLQPDHRPLATTSSDGIRPRELRSGLDGEASAALGRNISHRATADTAAWPRVRPRG